MTLEEVKSYNNKPVVEEELQELINSEFVDDYEDLGQSPYFPELRLYVLYLNDKSEVYVSL